jgi:hypothetical protein
MRTSSILKFALAGILLTAFIAPNAMAESYQYAMSSQLTSSGASWLLNTNESISVPQGATMEHGYLNTFNQNYPAAGPCYIYRLSSTIPTSGLNPSLSGYDFGNYLLSSGSYNDDDNDKVTVSGTASGFYVMSTSHYYYQRNSPYNVWYPPNGAVKCFTAS